ncbi:MAG: nucleotide sugar dehydrogenase [Ignavibacteriales bacterium]|nr:MAG: nucleotide sugar dehydrogenase [Ignavibacteriales bacterium]
MSLLEKINNNSAVIGIIGLGYVGLPLALEFANKKFKVIGFDNDPKKPVFLNRGQSYIKHINAGRIKDAVDKMFFSATDDFTRLPEADAIIICVPTPLDEHREPDVSYIVNSGKVIAQYLRKDQLVVLESSTYPGTTDEILLPMFEQIQSPESNSALNTHNSKFKVGEDFYLAFSPEREDPNNPDFNTSTIPKVVGGVTPKCLEIAKALYDKIIVKTVPVSSTRAAEATKLLENIYRSVNIALVNEMKMVLDRMDIDVWEVIEAAKTKPFGFHAFYPGPGLGGHCIPIDPFYLTWKAHEYDISTKFIELAGEINTMQPYYVVEKSMEVLNKFKKSLNGSKVLILGASYKKDIDDMRESPTLKLIEIFAEKGAEIDYNDPYVPKLWKMRKYNYDLASVELTKENLAKYDLVVLSTDHTAYDYKFIAENSKIVIDTRNAFERNGVNADNVFKA